MSAKNLGLSNQEALRRFLRKYAEGRYRNSVVEFLPDNGSYLIFVEGSIQPFSDKAKTMLKRRILQDLNIEAQIAQFSNKTDARTSAALLQVLEPILGNNLIEVGVSTPTENSAEVIVFVHDLQKANDSNIEKVVTKKAGEFLKPYELSLVKLYLNELADGVPSPFQILRLVYTYAPINLGYLAKKLSEEQTPPPSERWLKRQLDNLIRNKVILWQESDTYVATASGIAALPPRKGRTSPDISRALVIARRK